MALGGVGWEVDQPQGQGDLCCFWAVITAVGSWSAGSPAEEGVRGSEAGATDGAGSEGCGARVGALSSSLVNGVRSGLPM